MIHVQFVPKTILLQTGHQIECRLDDNKIVIIVYIGTSFGVSVVNAGRKFITQTAQFQCQ